MKQLTMEQLTHRIASLVDEQNTGDILGALLNVQYSVLHMVDDARIIQAVGQTMLDMLDMLQEKAQTAVSEPKKIIVQ